MTKAGLLVTTLFAAVIGGSTFGTAAHATDDWKEQIKTVRFGVLSGENEKARKVQYSKFTDYLKRELGVEARIYTASSYAGVIQALAAGQIEFAFLGSSAYAAAWEETNGAVEPVLTRVEEDGSSGYFSVITVRCDSPYKSLDDLKGKTLAFADPNSTSGYQVPYFHLRKQGYTPEKFFGRTPFSGSHETGVLGVYNGQFDAAATHITDSERGIPQRMAERRMIPANTICVIWTSPEITSGPLTVRKDLNAELKKKVTDLVRDVPTKDPEAFASFSPGSKGFIPVDHERYAWVVEMNREIRKLHRQRTN